MIQVKLTYVLNGVEYVDVVESRIFTANAIADSFEAKALASTGIHVDVNPIRSHYANDNLMIFIFDVDNETMSGYAMWLDGEEENSDDSDDADTPEACVLYEHCNDPKGPTFRELKSSTPPSWAVNIREEV